MKFVLYVNVLFTSTPWYNFLPVYLLGYRNETIFKFLWWIFRNTFPFVSFWSTWRKMAPSTSVVSADIITLHYYSGRSKSTNNFELLVVSMIQNFKRLWNSSGIILQRNFRSLLGILYKYKELFIFPLTVENIFCSTTCCFYSFICAHMLKQYS